ncbi:MAG: sodium/solute symporter, partial [Deltaproteobacteria bacterium]|nr:sodium/solute symporter [Deltaproteobacteria bacterium]
MEASTIVGTKLDYAIIIFYFVAIFGFGAFFARFTRSTKDFFFGNHRFSWWLIAFSCIATTVGSYSFVKYSAAGYNYGLSSSMTYLNDWPVMGLFLLSWFPIIYFSKVSSIPEYFQRRFDTKTRLMAVLILMIYMIGYIGINLYTMGVALNALLGTNVFWSAAVVAIVCALYVTAGGQTSVIMTDLLQGILLLVAGFVLFGLGLIALGGWGNFWDLLPEAWRLPFAKFNEPHQFNFVGIFWQDGGANTIAFWFMNQGLILRFLSLKSVKDGRKALIFILFILMPLAAIAAANAGWLGKAFTEVGLLPKETLANHIFVKVADKICVPGVFGLIMAALVAALMSTIDTLINAVSVVFVNDLYKPYIVKRRGDKHYLTAARAASLAAGVIGIFLVPLFASFKSIYVAHGAFLATVTPPMAVAIVLGAFWKRYTTTAAFWTLLGGSIAIAISIWYPTIISPIAHGIDPAGGFKYMRALFGLISAGIIGVTVSYFTKPKRLSEISGLVVGTLESAREKFKGGKVNYKPGPPITGTLQLIDGKRILQLHKSALSQLNAI